MKKIAVAFLSVFMILGGLILSACDKEVTLTLLTNKEITIYTNNESAENFKKGQVDVRVTNSSAGIRVEVLKGADLIQLSDVKRKNSERYSFEISTLSSKKSGEAEIKVTAIENSRQSEIITVNVNTILEGLDLVQGDSVEAKSNNFIVKSSVINKKGKTLLVDDYFELNPITANDYEIIWALDDGSVDGVYELKDAEKVIAQIEGNVLWVSDEYRDNVIKIKAKDVTTGKSNSATLDVLDDATIENFSFADTDFYQDGVLITSVSKEVVLKRNNSNESSAIGELEINSGYDVVIEPVVYLGDQKLSRAEYEQYLIFNITDVSKNEVEMKNKYIFTVDVLDVFNLQKSATLKFFLNISYKDYNYSVLTDAKIEIRSFYQATRVELYNKSGDILNESSIDVFSNYVGKDGYELRTALLPDDVGIDDYGYKIYINASQTALNGIADIGEFARFYYRGEEVEFRREAGNFVSERILNTTNLYVVASETKDVLENVTVDFISESNDNARTSVIMNFYKISVGDNLDVKDEDGNEIIDPYYISSSEKSTRTLYLQFKINGLSTVSGLSVSAVNSKFVFGELTLVSSDDAGMVVGVEVSLDRTNIEESTLFCFEHISGRRSNLFTINSFIPIISASVTNGDLVSSSVFKDESTVQNFVLEAGVVKTSEDYKDSSLSRLMLEAGASLPIVTNIYNATLKEDISYKYLSYESLKLSIAGVEGIVGEDLDGRTNEVFYNNELEYISAFYTQFEEIDSSLFVVSGNKLVLRDVEFKGYVASIYTGYGENHEELTLVRFFALESFNSVQYLSSNISTAKLYTVDTLSYLDVGKSYVDVSIAFRSDLKVPTYTKDLSMFNFASANGVSDPFVDGESDGSFIPSETKLIASNNYYTLSDFAFTNLYRGLRFRITADTTKMLSQVRDILTITYQDKNGFVRQTEIQIEIKNVKRLESVEWTTQTINNEVYFNVASTSVKDENFTISTYCAPSDANDNGLTYWYDSIAGNSNAVKVTASQSGQSYNLKLNTRIGGYGDLYLMPNDMVKSVNGLQYVLLYKYTTDSNGDITETAVLKRVSEIGSIYENLVDETKVSAEFDQYFYNNDGEKIFYKDILIKIRIVIADGLTEQTAIRVYTQSDLQDIDYSRCYRVMNDITLSGWQTLSATDFSGMIFGDNENVTLRFTDNSGVLINKISSVGVVKDLTLVGKIKDVMSDYCGFVARRNEGTVQNIKIDVDYTANQYQASEVESVSLLVGGLVGKNSGRVIDCFSYGVNVKADRAVGVGGLVGENYGTISESAVEFYNFSNESAGIITVVSNKIVSKDEGYIGGLVGYAWSGTIEKSYVYAYSLNAGDEYKNIFEHSGSPESNGSGAFIGCSKAGVVINECFAYVGNLKTPFISNGDQVSIKNSYISYYVGGTSAYQINTRIFKDEIFEVASDGSYLGTAGNKYTESDIGTDYWTGLGLDENVWQLADIDENVNFGFIHLKNIKKTTPADVSTLTVANNTEPLKSLSADLGKNGILFVNVPTVNVSNEVELYALNSLNTISVSDLFGVSEDEAKSLVLTTKSRDVSISANSVRMINVNISEFDIEVHSKMDFSKYETFKFVILNNLPEIKMLLDGIQIRDEQTVLLQKGETNTRDVIFNLNSSVYLGGSEIYQTYRDNYSIKVNPDADTNVKISKSGYKLTLNGLNSHADDDVTEVSTNLVIDGLDSIYQAEIDKIRSNKFNVSVYDGASAVIVENATNLTIKSSRYASFDATIVTDNTQENLLLLLRYDDVDILDEDTTDNFAKFVVDSELTLEASWTVNTSVVDGKYVQKYKVIVRIANDKKHLITKNYDLSLIVNATTFATSTSLAKTLGIGIVTQEISDMSISAYEIESRQVKNSRLYFVPTTGTTNTLMPSSDAIISVILEPAYAMMTHFKLTYSLVGESGTVGTVNISKLKYDSVRNLGYYQDSENVTLVENGLQVYLTEEDKTGSGVFYFRIYVSGAFKTQSDLKLSLTCYNYETELKTVCQNLNVDYISDATVKVNNVSNYIMSKGSTATVTVKVGLDQDLYDLNLQNVASGIVMSSVKEEVFQTYKQYSATLTAYVDAKLTGNRDNGVFYVNAIVSKVINGVKELKQSSAMVCLVDFALDKDNAVKVQSSGAQQTYNGKDYDVFYAYVNATDSLIFDYSINPKEYIYDADNASEVEAVEKLREARSEFIRNNSYKNVDADYYINYQRDEMTGQFSELTLKQQLWYAQDEETATAVYNGNYINQNKLFEIKDNGTNKTLDITGKTSGTQLMKLRTTIYYQGTTFVYDYYFLIVVEVWSDEETPTQITTASEFINYATNSKKSDDYILMNDIVLNNYTPVDTKLFDSLDGNGFTIHINSFAMPESGSKLNLALFDNVTDNTTLKNVRVNIYGAGDLDVDISQYKTINIAGFAISNNGIIYNCEVVSYYDETYQTSKKSISGIIVDYMLGANTDPIKLTTSMKVTSNVAGFVVTNKSSITNSRVGGESFRHIVKINNTEYLKTEETDLFVIQAQGNVAGFVISNGTVQTDEDNVLGTGIGYISACFVDNIQVYNNAEYTTSLTAGFVLNNYNYIYGSYVEGASGDEPEDGSIDVYNTGSNMTAMGIIAGFVYSNDGTVKNSYANIAIENEAAKGALVSGFVYMNNRGANISLCYASCKISQKDVNEMQFSGVDNDTNSLNKGDIELSYYYSPSTIDDSNQSKISSGALGISDTTKQETFYGFSFASSVDSCDGIWVLDSEKLTLASANQIAISNRYSVTNGVITNVFYNKNVKDYDTYVTINLAYGSDSNPIIIRTAEEFAMATGKAKTKEISYYKEYYSENFVFGNYRLVKNLDMSIFEQISDNEDIAVLTTMKKIFKGALDGNGFTITNISLLSSEKTGSYGLFAELDGAVVMNLNLVVKTISNAQANVVGTIAGVAIDSRLSTINITPVKDSSNSRTSIFGNNVVGGVVGMLFGDSKLNDITARSVIVYSSYYKENKTIKTNNDWTGLNLRGNAESGTGLDVKVSNLSYAGAIAGYVDVYKDINSNSLKFKSSLDVTQFNVITVHVTDSVDIYGEVSGGLFGYIGSTTLVYDATLELSADSTLNTPSYIISKNLFAGGLIGESYGGLVGVYTSYSDDLQKSIEENEHSYYKGARNVERGQQSIFSYADGENIQKKTCDPKFIGGLVGYMGGGYIYVGYNKLNVVSNDVGTYAVGGLVGFAGYNSQKFNLPFSKQTAQASLLLYEVYSSGDIQNKNGYSAGVVGGIESYNGKSAVIAMKNVLALNYYSVDGDMINGDSGTEIEGKYLANKHFTITGKVYEYTSDGLRNAELSDKFYIYRSDDNVYDVYNNSLSGYGVSTFETVGGYISIILNGKELYLDPYGFMNRSTVMGNISEPGQTSRTEALSNVASVEHIGSENCSNISTAYARLYSYFLPVGWAEKFWTHKENNLFPNIELTPRAEVIYLDATEDSIENALKIMRKGGYETIVVRGMLHPEISASTDCTDIDLTKYDLSGIDFAGRLVSYYEYMNSTDYGIVTVVTDRGGKKGAQVGIIINKPMFESLEIGAKIEGVSFYFNASEDSGVIDYSLISGEVDSSTITKVNLIMNSNVSYEVKYESATQNNMAGILAKGVLDTSINNVEIRFRASYTYTATINDINGKDMYVGVLVGKVRQGTGLTRSSISGIDIMCVDTNDNKTTTKAVEMTISSGVVASEYQLYAGLYAGAIIKESTEENTISAINFAALKLNNVNIKLEMKNAKEVYVGGYAGQVCGINSVAFDGQNSASTNGINIIQSVDIGKLYAGLMFGDIENSNLRNFSSGSDTLVLKGSIYQVPKKTTELATTELAYIGGIAGKSNSIIDIKGISVDFTLTSVSDDGVISKPNYDNNLNDYAGEVKPYIIKESASAIGGLFGNVTNEISAYNKYSVTGYIDVQLECSEESDYIYIGGWIGHTTSSFKAYADGTTDIDISVNAGTGVAGMAYVGGLIGYANDAASVTEIDILINETGNSELNYAGNILSSMKNLKAGGAIGYLNRNSNSKVLVKSYIYGGAMKVYGGNINGGSVTVGGIVGESENSTEDKFVISDSYSYGDVFVNYKDAESKLNAYNFGGIIGKAGAGISATGTSSLSSVMKISNCYSLMTSFNSRLSDASTTAGSWVVGEYNVGAIVGGNQECVTYDGNYYSSAATLTNQESYEGNTDLPYGKNSAYVGYGQETFSSESILSKFVGFKTSATGTKLDPIVYDDGKEAFSTDGKNTTNGICWVSVEKDIEISSAISDNLDNVAFIGNGYVITRTNSTDDIKKTQGGLFDDVGGKKSEGKTDFNIISGLTVNLKVDANFKSGLGLVYYGGVAGTMANDSIIYAVAVKGEASIGVEENVTGTNLDTNPALSGIVGQLKGGFIKQSYSDADLIYRANEDGYVSGIAYVNGDTYTAVNACYTSGTLTSYVGGVTLSGLAYANAGENNYFNDCYSISPLVFKGIEGSGSCTKGMLNGVELNTRECFTLKEISGGNDKLTSEMAIGYTDGNVEHDSKLAKLAVDKGNPIYESLTKWFFNSDVNYGYASHGFGFMANVTAYTRYKGNESEKTADDEDDDEYKTITYTDSSTGVVTTKKYLEGHDESAVWTYGYIPVSYAELFSASADKSGWYYGVLNVGKLNQMVDATQSGKLNFVLRNDLISATTKLTDTHLTTNSDVKNLSSSDSVLGKTGKGDLVDIDGNNKTIDVSSFGVTNSLFRTVYGNIINLNLINVNISNDVDESVGGLAMELSGNINNISVSGDISSTTNGETIGGVVGVLTGNAIAVANSVNITGGTKVGGIAGQLAGEVSFCSNNGIINAKLGNAGGIVGEATGKLIAKYCYNTNSVLSSYVANNGLACAGGIVGRLEEANCQFLNCYNTGFVGAGHVKNTENKVYAGGIFGFSSNKLSIKNCINEGAVEAIGKIDATSENGYGFKTTTIAGYENINDFKSKSAVEDLTYEVKLTYGSGDRMVYAYGIGYTGAVYDKDSYVNNYTTTDNIKNEGNIGTIEQKKELKFDRKSMVGGDVFKAKFSASTDVYVNGIDNYGFPTRVYMTDTITRGYFGKEENGKSEIQLAEEKFGFIKGKEDAGAYFYDQWAIEYNGKYTTKKEGMEYSRAEGQSKAKYWAVDSKNKYDIENNGNYNNQTLFSGNNIFENDYIMAGSTTYYSSVEFDSFTEYLQKLNVILGVSDDSKNDSNEAINNANVTTNDLSKQIGIVAKLRESKSTQTIINGKSTAIVKNGDTLSTIYTPYHYQYQYVIDINQGDYTIDPTLFRKENYAFGFTAKNAKDEDILPAYVNKSHEYNDDEKIITITFDMYFAEEVKSFADTKVNVTYTTQPQTIILGKNNVANLSDLEGYSAFKYYENGEFDTNPWREDDYKNYVAIICEDNDGNLKNLLESIYSSIYSKDDDHPKIAQICVGEKTLYDSNDSAKIANFALGAIEGSYIYCIKESYLKEVFGVGFTLDELNGKRLTFVAEYEVSAYIPEIMGANSSESTEAEFTFTAPKESEGTEGSATTTGEITLCNYITATAGELGINEDDIISKNNNDDGIIIDYVSSMSVRFSRENLYKSVKSYLTTYLQKNYSVKVDDNTDFETIYICLPVCDKDGKNFEMNIGTSGSDTSFTIDSRDEYKIENLKYAILNGSFYFTNPKAEGWPYEDGAEGWLDEDGTFKTSIENYSFIPSLTNNDIKFQLSYEITANLTKKEGSENNHSEHLKSATYSYDFPSVSSNKLEIMNETGEKIGYEISYTQAEENAQTKWMGVLGIKSSVYINIDPSKDGKIVVKYKDVSNKLLYTDVSSKLSNETESENNPTIYGQKDIIDGTYDQYNYRIENIGDADNPSWSLTLSGSTKYGSDEGKDLFKINNSTYKFVESTGECSSCGDKKKYSETTLEYFYKPDVGSETYMISTYRYRIYECGHDEILFSTYNMTRSKDECSQTSVKREIMSNSKTTDTPDIYFWSKDCNPFNIYEGKYTNDELSEDKKNTRNQWRTDNEVTINDICGNMVNFLKNEVVGSGEDTLTIDFSNKFEQHIATLFGIDKDLSNSVIMTAMSGISWDRSVYKSDESRGWSENVYKILANLFGYEKEEDFHGECINLVYELKENNVDNMLYTKSAYKYYDENKGKNIYVYPFKISCRGNDNPLYILMFDDLNAATGTWNNGVWFWISDIELAGQMTNNGKNGPTEDKEAKVNTLYCANDLFVKETITISDLEATKFVLTEDKSQMNVYNLKNGCNSNTVVENKFSSDYWECSKTESFDGLEMFEEENYDGINSTNCKLEVIFGGFDEITELENATGKYTKNIWFSRYTLPTPLIGEDYNAYMSKTEGQSMKSYVNLYYNSAVVENGTTFNPCSEYANAIGYEYRTDMSYYISANKDDSITYDQYGYCEYFYRIIFDEEYDNYSYKTTNTTEKLAVENIILWNDVYINGCLGENTINVYGNDKSITFYATGEYAFISGNSGIIQNLRIVSNVSDISPKANNTAITSVIVNNKDKKGMLKNVSIYGNIRNGSTSASEVSVKAVDINEYKNSVSNLNTYISIFNLKNIIVADTYGYTKSSESNSNNIIIMPDADAGQNGRSGNSGLNINGENGDDAKLVYIDVANYFNGYIKLGLGGIGGYGANGENGTIGHAGKGGGAPGYGGKNGYVSGIPDGESVNIISTRTRYGEFAISQYGGNGGVGGLGTIDENGYLTYSAGGGGAGGFVIGDYYDDEYKNLTLDSITIESNKYYRVKGGDGELVSNTNTTTTWNVNKSVSGIYDYTYFGISSNQNLQIQLQGVEFSEKFFFGKDVLVTTQNWIGDINTVAKRECESWLKYQYYTGGKGFSDGGGNKISEINICLKVQERITMSWFISGTYEEGERRVLVWTSGELLNSAGSAGYTGVKLATKGE